MSAPRALSQHAQSAVGPRQLDDGAAGGGSGGQAAGADADVAAAAPRRARGSAKFRFWHDERRFKGPADRCIVQQALFDAGGVRTGGYPKCSPLPGPLGHQRAGDWDMLWSPARTALKALPALKPGQLVSALPGMMSITKKRRLSVTLKQAYGADAFDLVPLTFSLPSELGAWRAWLDAEAAAGREPGPWMLKTAQHLGMGLCLLPGEQAFAHALVPRAPAAKPWVLAQRYVADPLLIGGRKFGVRLWVLVTGAGPLRAYLSDRGLVLFSTEGYDAESLSDDGEVDYGEGSDASMGGAAAAGAAAAAATATGAGAGAGAGAAAAAAAGGAGRGHVTNYAQNVDGQVWDLDMLREHLGGAAYDALWSKLVSSAARVVAATLPEVLSEQAKLQAPPNSTFELLGLDYLVDADHHPWLLEVNGTPSLAVEHSDGGSGMVRDMVSLLGCATRFDARYNLLRAAVAKDRAAARRLRGQLAGGGGDDAALALARREVARRGGFLPLMPYFDVDGAFTKGYAIPWGARDFKLAEAMAKGGGPRQPGGGGGSGGKEGGGGEAGGGGARRAGAAAAGSSSSSSEALLASVRGGTWPMDIGDL
ncbi:MAG: tubulin-tyrosine ligase family-domain-containing protein [Monoraphidium minutum]|nr:MAG: tubulin-tyrosine ligase family-domain-containing protein [Monoraphidium minutum]